MRADLLVAANVWEADQEQLMHAQEQVSLLETKLAQAEEGLDAVPSSLKNGGTDGRTDGRTDGQERTDGRTGPE